jgi:hypothetical protein
MLAALLKGFLGSVRPAKQPSSRKQAERDRLTTRAMQGYLLYVLLPVWTIPGFADYLCHRRTSIETTSGTQESITHSLMMASVGVPALMTLFFEVNALSIAVAAACVAGHEAVVLWDTYYAAPRRFTSVTEQHVHSFLEVLPFTTLAFLMCLRPNEVLGMLGHPKYDPDYSLRWKVEPPPPAYVASLLLVITGAIGIPYAEELLRCMLVDPSPSSRPKQRTLTEAGYE